MLKAIPLQKKVNGLGLLEDPEVFILDTGANERSGSQNHENGERWGKQKPCHKAE
jgi:hypothetical protein